MSELTPGWLGRHLERVSVDVAMWPEDMRRLGGFTDEHLTPSQRKEAARRLRARADELDPPERKPTALREKLEHITTAGNDYCACRAHEALCLLDDIERMVRARSGRTRRAPGDRRRRRGRGIPERRPAGLVEGL